MNKIKTIIIDDEQGNIITLTEMLNSYCPDVILAGTANNITDGEKLIYAENPDLVFLDIEMPFGNGFELLNRLMPIKFEVVFITAFNNYAIKAFKYSVVDYLLKPVNIEELKVAVLKVRNKLDNNNVTLRIDSLLSNLKIEKSGQKKIGIATEDGIIFEEIDNIMYLEAEGSYTNIYIKGGRTETTPRSLKDFEDMLPESIFFRVHNSSIINVNYINKYYKGSGGYVEMEDNKKIEVSQRKKDDFLTKIKG